MLVRKAISYIKDRKSLRYLIGILTGGTIGFLYYWFIGCNTGTCPLTSNPYNSIVIGSVMGFLWTFSPGKSEKAE